MLVLSCFFGCSDSFEYSNQTVVGQITAIDGQNITVLLGELTENTFDGQGDEQFTPPEMPDASQGDSDEQFTPPEVPEGDDNGGILDGDISSTLVEGDEQDGQAGGEMFGGNAPEKPDGGQGQGDQEPPEMPNGGENGGILDGDISSALVEGDEQDGQAGGEMFGGNAPEKPDGDQEQGDQEPPEMPDGEQPDNMPDGMSMQTFTAGDESITIEVDEDTAQSLSVDDVIQITFGDGKTVDDVTVVDIMPEMAEGDFGKYAMPEENGASGGGGGISENTDIAVEADGSEM